MKLNVNRVLKEVHEKASREKPLPRIKAKQTNGAAVKPAAKPNPVSVKPDAPAPPTAKELLLTELWIEFGNLKRARGKLSTDIAYQVETAEAMLRAENPRIADEFMAGKIPMPELIIHSLKIQEISDQMTEVWDRIRHVEHYGKLPDHVEPGTTLKLQETSIDVKAIQYEIRRLDDLICKTEKKVRDNQQGIKKPKNTLRLATWNEKIALAEAARNDLKLKLKNLQYESREERTSAE